MPLAKVTLFSPPVLSTSRVRSQLSSSAGFEKRSVTLPGASFAVSGVRPSFVLPWYTSAAGVDLSDTVASSRRGPGALPPGSAAVGPVGVAGASRWSLRVSAFFSPEGTSTVCASSRCPASDTRTRCSCPAVTGASSGVTPSSFFPSRTTEAPGGVVVMASVPGGRAVFLSSSESCFAAAFASSFTSRVAGS